MSSIDYATKRATRRHHQHAQRPGTLTPLPVSPLPKRSTPSTQSLVDTEVEAWARRAARSSGFGAPEAGWLESD